VATAARKLARHAWLEMVGAGLGCAAAVGMCVCGVGGEGGRGGVLSDVLNDKGILVMAGPHHSAGFGFDIAR